MVVYDMDNVTALFLMRMHVAYIFIYEVRSITVFYGDVERTRKLLLFCNMAKSLALFVMPSPAELESPTTTSNQRISKKHAIPYL